MNYFELFGIPIQLSPDPRSMRNTFIDLSRKFHPDYNQSGPGKDQLEILEKSAQLNKAWKTFQNRDETIKYVLKLKGLLEEEEKYELPPDFLMEVLEINEALMNDEGNLDVQSTRVKELQTEIYEPVKDIVENYKDSAATKEELLQVKDYYYKKKYLDRIQKQLTEMQ